MYSGTCMNILLQYIVSAYFHNEYILIHGGGGVLWGERG